MEHVDKERATEGLIFITEMDISLGCRQGEWLQGRHWSSHLVSGMNLLDLAPLWGQAGSTLAILGHTTKN